ncbi:hypothetical protein PZE06_13185 [Robertmurraya sp. DFI.2.37]|uniref:hypothetical protein n=1 Tax=Robertmurraya sp. DFI.2.37 TaxID=3031819 RepID=UPI00124651FA|nr:hypothetical protein [Robertmurraya sp. DFI.2.37]MDF1509125.1 hypothetical protein [Robertmurraya sp. DFI.2.37]
MQILLILIICLLIYFLKIRKLLLKDKQERRWYLLLSALCIMLAIALMLEFPLYVVTSFFNYTLGEITKQVIKI